VALVAAGVVALVWLVAVVRLGVWRQLHHFYYGLALLPFHSTRWAGVAIMADDAVQHFVQLWRSDYRSPLHLLARVTWYRWVNWP
jgi:hypothetical protein